MQPIGAGVLLQVTPHINAGGLVTLDVQAEVSSPGTPAAAGDAPPIDTRSVQTLLAVPSGQTMVMGGLIQETKGTSSTGLPILNRIPGLGGLFGNQSLQNDRSELVLFITPHTVTDSSAIQSTIDDLRRKMETLDRVFPGTPNWPASPPDMRDRLNEMFNPYRWELPRPAVPKPIAPPAGQPTDTLPPPAPKAEPPAQPAGTAPTPAPK